ncbi:MAG: MFS transporter [Gammaproteobacteria bacterium]|nr:MFS transporter [Gammaproteobacteria bacterium]
MSSTESAPRRHPLAAFMRALSRIEANELRATFASFGFVFVLMAAYYILKPVRDAMASDWSDAQVSWLWTINLFVTLVMNLLYSLALSLARLKVVVPALYGFFALSFVGFAFGADAVAGVELTHKAFYVWVSVFSLFHVSVFWSFMADLYSKEQARRLFGFIATGASVGGLVGPLVPLLLAGRIGNGGLMVVAAVLLLGVMPLIAWLERLKVTELHNLAAGPAVQPSIGGNPFAGFTHLLRSPFLLGVAVFLFFYTSLSSFIYFELKNLLAPFDPSTRTQIQSGINWAINVCTILTAVVATGRLSARYGLSVTLALVPLLMVGGLAAVAVVASVWIVVFAQVALKAGNYAITRPGREMLFTLVSRETRFKTKPVIDTLVYRIGDSLNAWSFTALSQGLGLGMSALALIGAGIAAVWALMGVVLGRAYGRAAPPAGA